MAGSCRRSQLLFKQFETRRTIDQPSQSLVINMDNTTTTFGTSAPAFVSKGSPMLRSLPWLVALLLGYPLLQQYLRYQRLKAMKMKYKYHTRQDLAKMTDQEAWEIFHTLAELEFPTMFEKGINFDCYFPRDLLLIRSIGIQFALFRVTQLLQ